jgi:WD40 repeat protein/Ca2+-binding EF-hand superfamily protein
MAFLSPKAKANLLGSDIEQLEPGMMYDVPEKMRGFKLTVEWISVPGLICDLDLVLYCFDDRGRLVERLDFGNMSLSGIQLSGDAHGGENGSHAEDVSFEFDLIEPSVTAVLVYLDGGPRNYQLVQCVLVHCNVLMRLSSDKEKEKNPEQEFLASSSIAEAMQGNTKLWSTLIQTKKDYCGVCCGLLFKSKWIEGVPCFAYKALDCPSLVSTNKEKDELTQVITVNNVPSLFKFKPKLFQSVREICAALSSEALPMLKKKFLMTEGLDINQFKEVIFGQLCTTHPKVMSPNEAPFTVAMLEEMFAQIDFNGDGDCTWEEFTSFAIQQGLSSKQAGSMAEPGSDVLDEYKIQYREVLHLRDRHLSAHRLISLCKHVPEIKRILVIPEGANHVLIFNESFQLFSTLDPNDVARVSSGIRPEKDDPHVLAAKHNEKTLIFDICYLDGRDLYAFCSSNHTITIVKEQVGMSGKKVSYLGYNKIFHNYLHEKLCWSAKHKILCSVSANQVIYGWDIDSITPIFNVSRHADVITDFIAIDELDLFVTASLDKRVVVWGSISRRVKAVFRGYTRGVTCVSYAKKMLLTAGFETEIKIWDIASKEPFIILRGHRKPVTSAKMMCHRSTIPEEYRAVSVDETGEFRLWNLYVKERTAQAHYAPVLQIFNISVPDPIIARVHTLMMLNDNKLSTSYYSNIGACSSKLLNFIPEKIAKEFIPTIAATFSETAGTIFTVVGRSVLKYDIVSGYFVNYFPELEASDITAICMDGARGRRIYVGCANGRLLLINSVSGAVLEDLHVTKKDITSIVPFMDQRLRIYCSSVDGSLRMLEEVGGRLNLHNSVECAFGDGIGVAKLELVSALSIVVAIAAGNQWGVWSSITFKKIFVIKEQEPVTTMAVLGASGDEFDEHYSMQLRLANAHSKVKQTITKENILTIGICLGDKVVIYAVDVYDGTGVISLVLTHGSSPYICQLLLLRPPADGHSINYALSRSVTSDDQRASAILLGGTDDGCVLFWNASKLRAVAESKFREEHNPANIERMREMMERQTEIGEPKTARTDASTEYSASRPQTSGSIGSSHSVQDSMHSGLLSPDRDAANIDLDEDVGDEKFVLSEPAEESKKVQAKTHEISLVDDIPSSLFGIVDDVPKQTTYRDMRAHMDMISVMLSLETHGSFITVGFDGFKRIWNIDAECLGEMQLPNLTVSMRDMINRAVYPTPKYRFILGRITVTDEHGIEAKKLVKYWKKLLREKRTRQRAGSSSLSIRTGSPMSRAGSGRTRTFSTDMKYDSDEDDTDKYVSCMPVKHHHVVATLGQGDTDEEGEKEKREGDPNEGEPESSAKATDRSAAATLQRSRVKGKAPVNYARVRKEMLTSLGKDPVHLADDEPPPNVLTKGDLRKIKQLREFKEFKAKQESRIDSLFMSQSQNTIGDGKTSDGLPDILDVHRPKSTVVRPTSAHSDNSGSTSQSTAYTGKQRDEDLLAATNIDMTGDRPMWCQSGDPRLAPGGKSFTLPDAFSAVSLEASRNDGYLDDESHRYLRHLSKDLETCDQYERVADTIMLRNAKLSTSVVIPELNSMRQSEVNFGAQKDMYVNADALLVDREKINRKSLALSRHTIAQSRIDLNLKKIGSMVHFIPPAAANEVPMPDFSKVETSFTALNRRIRKEEAEMSMKLMKSSMHAERVLVRRENEMQGFSSPELITSLPNYNPSLSRVSLDYDLSDTLNRQSLSEKVDRVEKMIAQDPEELEKEKAALLAAARKKSQKLANKLINSSYASKDVLEDKLAHAIKVYHREEERKMAVKRGAYLSTEFELQEQQAAEEEKKEATHMPKKVLSNEKLTNRALAPYYKVAEVQTFLDVFTQVDTDFSGDLDIHEWIRLFTAMDKSNTMSVHQARMLFLQIDKKGEGYLSIRELVPIVFSKANKVQRKLILTSLESEIIRKRPDDEMISLHDLELLFECYDVDTVGFVSMGLVRDRIRELELKDSYHFAFMESIAKIEDDELVNAQEFARVFKNYVQKANKKDHRGARSRRK